MLSAERINLAAIGDDLIGPMIESGRRDAGLERLFVSRRVTTWLQALRPDIGIDEHAVFGFPGATTVDIAKRTVAILDLPARPHAVLISVGLDDCRCAVKGTAPAAPDSVRAIEMIALEFATAGIRPVFIVPPPSPLFSNGLFADRFIAIAATLRRLAATGRIDLVDATAALTKRRAFGIEPDPRYVTGGENAQLSEAGAMRLAGEVARVLPASSAIPASDCDAQEALNENPHLSGAQGVVGTGIASGSTCATGYALEAHQIGGATINAGVGRRPDGAAQRIAFSGRYTSPWAMIRLQQDFTTRAIDGVASGDTIEASCDVSLAGPLANIAAVSLHATIAWDNDFIGLHSSRYAGGGGLCMPFAGRFRTPTFALPADVRKLHVAVDIHLVPGTDLAARGYVDIRSIRVRKMKRADGILTLAGTSESHARA